MLRPQKTLVFDLDGTLIDSIRDLVPALNAAISADNLPPLTLEQVGPIVGDGALKMIAHAYKINKRPLTDDLQKELFSIFLQSYEAHIADKTVFYEGALEALDKLESKGWIFAVCTNKYERYARQILDEMGEIDRFAAITGGDTFGFKKPDPAHIFETIKLAGGSPEHSIMVGDTTNDIFAAQRANIPSIVVDFGYYDCPVISMNATTIISHFNELERAAEMIINGEAY